MTRPRRAPPLDREARRLKIIERVTPLLAARGAAVTTRELAAAAGVAEGTLFCAFEDKHSLLMAVIGHRLDPRPLREKLARFVGDETLDAGLVGVANVVLPSITDVYPLVVALHGLADPARESQVRGQGAIREWLGAVSDAVVAVTTPHAAELRVTPARFSHMFSTLLFASRMPHLAAEDRATAEDIVRFCLRGALKSPQEG
ncbi:MAG TPA: TetR/AcrR family transcriptional regulator [Trueperaceae bacterium]|nr:TetR/AcrR family transcriptional regulator [Trueperaceae bacterium]HRP46348.1 TetR/AcrR family transcriptional regulator [Trueperaceae bacterium]